MTKKLDAVLDRIEKKRYIAAIKSPKDFDQVLVQHEGLAAAYLLMGNISNIKRYTEKLKEKGIPVFIHIEKIGGLALNAEGLEFISKVVAPDGILTTKKNLLKYAHNYGLITIQRVFMIDTEVFENLLKPKEFQADFIEIMPSTLHSIIRDLVNIMKRPILAGGLIQSVDDVKQCIQAGAVGVSTSNRKVWGQCVY